MFHTITNENCLDMMGRMENDSVDLTVTSPPYDDLREYNGYSFDFESIANEICRVTKPGGVIVWIVGDATVNGSETGTSFKQALYFKDVCGFRIHDTMIWNKGGFSAVGALQTRYAPVFEYMFIFSKGKPKSFNPIKDRANKHAGRSLHGTVRQVDGTVKIMTGNKEKTIQDFGQRFNVWDMPAEMRRGLHNHPAPFPESISNDHILSWSNVGDIVMDPFLGSGTTGVCAVREGRIFIGSEISDEYFVYAKQRIENVWG